MLVSVGSKLIEDKHHTRIYPDSFKIVLKYVEIIGTGQEKSRYMF